VALGTQTAALKSSPETKRGRAPLTLEGAERSYLASLDWARRQQAKMWELRTSTSLARLWQSQDRRQEAYELLVPVYDWFTEGFDSPDLLEARALLNELAS